VCHPGLRGESERERRGLGEGPASAETGLSAFMGRGWGRLCVHPDVRALATLLLIGPGTQRYK
jgi:hypothetical protein